MGGDRAALCVCVCVCVCDACEMERECILYALLLSELCVHAHKTACSMHAGSCHVEHFATNTHTDILCCVSNSVMHKSTLRYYASHTMSSMLFILSL